MHRNKSPLTGPPINSLSGPTPNVDVVLSICLQSDLPTGQTANKQSFTAKGNVPSQNDHSGPNRGGAQRLPRDRRATKRKGSDSKFSFAPFKH